MGTDGSNGQSMTMTALAVGSAQCPNGGRAAMLCVKDAVGASDLVDIAIMRHHFDDALRLLTEERPAATTPEPPRLLLAG